jgi:hypothetical protein
MVFMVAGLFMPGMLGAGNIEPTAPPGPTMKTLEEIYDKLKEIDGKIEPVPCKGAPVCKTGQSISYSTGDDGDLERGVEWPVPRFTDNNDGTVTDELTDLIWLKNANCFGTRNWSSALTDCSGLANGSCGLTDGSVAGDWHLPNVRELQSLIDYARLTPALPAGHPFTGATSSYYWSSTTSVLNTSFAWDVTFGSGNVDGIDKSYNYYVWCVRGGP